jgi:hypothetical protein
MIVQQLEHQDQLQEDIMQVEEEEEIILMGHLHQELEELEVEELEEIILVLLLVLVQLTQEVEEVEEQRLEDRV